MDKPTAQQIDHWLNFADESITKRTKRLADGDINLAIYSALGGDYADRARVIFLRGDPVAEVRACFRQGAQMQEQSFIMAFDEHSPHYIGNTGGVKWGWVDEVCSIEMMSWALLSADFDYATHVAQWPRPTPDNDPKSMETCNYVYGLRDALLGDLTTAQQYIARTLKKYKNRPPVKNDFRRNYYTLTKTLGGILAEDEALFNEGLAEHLHFYRAYARGEASDTDEEYFCDKALALANLAIKQGLAVTVTSKYLPHGVLIDSNKP